MSSLVPKDQSLQRQSLIDLLIITTLWLVPLAAPPNRTLQCRIFNKQAEFSLRKRLYQSLKSQDQFCLLQRLFYCGKFNRITYVAKTTKRGSHENVMLAAAS